MTKQELKLRIKTAKETKTETERQETKNGHLEFNDNHSFQGDKDSNP